MTRIQQKRVEHLRTMTLAKRISKMPKGLIKLFDVLRDNDWHDRDTINEATGLTYSDFTRRLLMFRRCGFNVETKRADADHRKARYRLLDDVSQWAHLASEDRTVGGRPNPFLQEVIVEDDDDDPDKPSQQSLAGKQRWARKERSRAWFCGARRGVAEACRDLETGKRRDNPYAKISASEYSGWRAGYETMIDKGEDITLEHEEIEEAPRRYRVDRRQETQNIKTALMDWQAQAEGKIRVIKSICLPAQYVPDPSLTAEDIAFAREQVRRCMADMRDMGELP